MCCCQLEKIPLPPELPVFLAESIELGAPHTGEQSLSPHSRLATVDPGLLYPAGQAAGWKPEPLSNAMGGEDLLQAGFNDLRLLLRRELAAGFGGGLGDS